MRNAIADHAQARTALLAHALRDTVAELRLIEAGDMIAYMRTGRWANIADLVQSSAELFFAEGSIAFACSGDYAIGWSEQMSIRLDMEFQHADVTAFFALTLKPQETLVEIKKVWFATQPDDESVGTSLFSAAIKAARVGATPLL